MDKKKIIITTIVLLLGLGTFVFANPDENLEGNDIKELEDINKNDLSDSKSSTKDDDTEIVNGYTNDNYLNDIPNNITPPNTVLSNLNQYFNGNNQANNNHNSNSGNNNSNSNNNGSTGDGSKPITPPDKEDKPDEKPGNKPDEKPEEKPDLPIIDDINEIRVLIDTLNNKVINATSRADILNAIDYRDKNNIIKSVDNILDQNIKLEFQAILDDLNIILDDDKEPLINGIKNHEYTNKNVNLSIVEESINKVFLNDQEITDLDLLKNIDKEGSYTLVVTDKAFNETKIIFTIDFTKPIVSVTTSNNNQITSSSVVVYIKANEELQEVLGWNLSKDGKTLSKTFDYNTGLQVIEVCDLAGNKVNVEYEVMNIKNNKPSVDEKDIFYSTKELTNGDVIVTIKVSKPVFAPVGWTPSEGYTVFTKTFTKNETEIVLLRDILGNTNIVNIVVDNIDKDAPQANVVYSIDQSVKTNDKVKVDIKLNERIKKPLDGSWTISNDSLTLSKTFIKNAEEIVQIEDLVGNKTNVPIKVQNIDKNLDGIIVKTSNNDVSTNNDVTVSIIALKELKAVNGWNLSDDKTKLTRIFDKVTKDIVEVETIDQENYAVYYEVKNLDKIAPVVKESDITYNQNADGSVFVTFTVSKSIFPPEDGWIASNGYTVFTKLYTESSDESICLRDIYGNTSNLRIKVNVLAIREINNFVRENTNMFSNLVSNIF